MPLYDQPTYTPAGPPPTSQPMHARDRRFWVILGIWAAIAVGSFGTGATAFISGSPHWGFGLCAVGLLGAVVATLHLLETRRIVPRQSHVNVVMVIVAAVTCAFIAWQTWMWLHRPTELVQVQGYTQAQADDAIAKAKDDAAKPLKDQLEALRQSNAQQTADAVAKATAPLRGQIAQLQSDTPTDAAKLPTSLRLLFKGADIEGIDAKNVVWTKFVGWRQRNGPFTSTPYPVWTIVIVFKKPIAYKAMCFEGHDSGIPVPDAAYDPHYALLQFDVGAAYGLVDFYAANECKK